LTFTSSIIDFHNKFVPNSTLIHLVLFTMMNPEQASPLIVDFPPCPRSKKSTKRISSPPREFRISPRSQLVFFEAQEEEQTLKFYSKEDQRHFQTEAMRDAQRISKKLTGSSEYIPSKDELCHLLGIEDLICFKRMRRMIQHRRDHVHRIVSLQDKCTADALRRLSKESSRPARRNAQRMAESYWKNLTV